MTADMRASGPLARPAPGAGTRRLFLRFDIAGDRYALAASGIVRILALAPLKGLPGAPAWVAGILLFGATPVPVIDLAALATGRPSAARASTRIAVVQYRGPDRLLGLLLEHATRTVAYDPREFQPYGLDNRDARYLGPVRPDADGMVQWVGVDELLPPDVRERLFQETGQEVAP
ncbi:chemotaxis protein CheW [Bordetella bronchialis]|nr:chemotaxis protein CheW [Bordetella bronchialis]